MLTLLASLEFLVTETRTAIINPGTTEHTAVVGIVMGTMMPLVATHSIISIGAWNIEISVLRLGKVPETAYHLWIHEQQEFGKSVEKMA